MATEQKPKYSLEDCIAEIERELRMRKKVYPAWIAKGKMDRPTALAQYWKLETALQFLERLLPQQGKLFDDKGYLKTEKKEKGKNQFD